MAYPPIYTRLNNFARDANNGLESPAPAKVDAELNSIQLSLAQAVDRLRAITTTDGRLRNVAQAVAQALVGTWSGASDGTVNIVTTIPWVSSMSVNSMLVMLGSTLLRPAQISSVVDNGSGYLKLVLASAPAAGTTIVVWAYEPGAGVLTKLASTAAGDGASVVGIHDSGNFYGATTVEGALAEIAGAFVALQVALGDLAEYFKRDGSVVATGSFDMAGLYKIINAVDGVNPGDLVTVRQMANYIAAWTNLQQFYLKRDGTTAMAGPLNFGNNKGQNLADPDLAQPLDAVNVRSMLKTVATTGATPVGCIMDYAGAEAPTGWLFCDGSAYKGDAYPTLYSILGTPYKEGSAQGCIVAVFAAVISGNLSGGALISLPPMTVAGQGYTGAPKVLCYNPDGSLASGQPSITFSVSTLVTDGPNVSGGVLTPTLVSGGSGIVAGASLVVVNQLSATPSEPALAELPAGYFRVPDLRGRVVVGSGTESKTPGITDPRDITKGDVYNSTPRDVGDFGGAEYHRLTIAEMPSHTHPVFSGKDGGDGGITGRNLGRWFNITANGYFDPTGGNVAHPNTPPFHVLNKIIKAA